MRAIVPDRVGAAPDLEVARAVSRRAADTLLALRDTGSAGRELGARGDAASQRVLAAGLNGAFPDDVLLSEEAPDEGADARASASRVWIIDPLDGTREYGEHGRQDWAVHVALWAHGDLVLGVVAVPGRPALLDSATVAPPPVPLPGARPRLAVSRSRPPGLVEPLATAIGAELVPLGSAGYKILSVVLGECDAYVHAGGQYEWDSAAPVAIARAAGLHTSRIDGSPLIYNRRDPWLPDLVICRPELARPILDAIAGGTP